MVNASLMLRSAAAERHAAIVDSILTSYLAAAHQLLARDGLTMSFSGDLQGWLQIMRSAQGTDGINPAFDPSVSLGDLSYFIHVVDASNDTVAVMAARRIETPDYHDYMRRGRLWTAGVDRPIPFIINTAGPAGVLSHCGGLWVKPAWRSIGLSWLVPRVNHALALHRWGIDAVVGLVFARLEETGIPARNYGVESLTPCIDGLFWPNGQYEQAYQALTSAEFILKRTWDDLDKIRNGSGQHMRDFAPIAKNRKQKASINRTAVV